MKKERCVVIGGGTFGILAAKRLRSLIVLVIEPNPSYKLKKTNIPILKQDGIKASVTILKNSTKPSWIIPMLPSHFLVEWLRFSLKKFFFQLKKIPIEILPNVANLNSGKNKEWYFSYTSSLCPNNCKEPKQFCKKTGLLRSHQPMFQYLTNTSMNGYQTIIIRSKQLSPGVGGLATQDILKLQKKIIDSKNSRWIIGTACRCHGVIQALNIRKKWPL